MRELYTSLDLPRIERADTPHERVALLFRLCPLDVQAFVPTILVTRTVSVGKDLSLPMTFSASRIGTWMACNRKAGFQYLCDYSDPGGVDTGLGQHVHGYLQWLANTPNSVPDRLFTVDGKDVGAIAAEAWTFVEEYRGQPGTVAEGQFFHQGRHAWTGFIDLLTADATVDYKTTGDFKWIKTPEELLVDPQAAVYASRYFSTAPADVLTRDVAWIYTRTKKPYTARVSRATFTREHAAKAFAALEAYADEFQAAAYAAPVDLVERHKYVLALAPNYDHCDAYRGCPHQTRCNISPFRARKVSKPVNLLEKLNAMNNVTATVAPDYLAARPAPAPVAPPAPPAAPTGDLMARLAAANGGHPTNPGGNAYNAAARSDIPGNGASTVTTGPAPTVAINPPKRGPGRPKGAKNDHPRDDARLAALSVPATTAEGVVHITPPPAERPAPLPLTIPQASAELAASLAQPTVTGVPIPTSHRIEVLFVGCIPFPHNEVDMFDDLIMRAKEMITLPVYFANYGYKTNGMMLEAIQRLIQADKPRAICIPDPRTQEATLALSYLRSVSQSVVEALR